MKPGISKKPEGQSSTDFSPWVNGVSPKGRRAKLAREKLLSATDFSPWVSTLKEDLCRLRSKSLIKSREYLLCL